MKLAKVLQAILPREKEAEAQQVDPHSPPVKSRAA
jgi:hypothetical protein